MQCGNYNGVKKMIKFGTGGWRAIIADDFTKANIRLLTAGLCELMLKEGHAGAEICVGYDRRFLSKESAHWAAEVLAGYGFRVYMVNRSSPTPLMMFVVKTHGMPYGMAVTASHNPAIYNGIKVFTAGGRDADRTVTAKIEAEIEELTEADVRSVDYDKALADGTIGEYNPSNEYIDSILAAIDVEAIKKAQLRIALDPMYGVSQTCLSMILMTCRCDLEIIHDRHDTLFGGKLPAPNEETMGPLSAVVLDRYRCDLGIATDGDADRIGAVDERGRYIHPHQIMALVLGDLVQFRNLEGRVVVNLSCSTLVRRIAEALGCRVTVKPVGFKYIAAEMKKGGVLIGGEEAGGIGIAAHMPERDGILACLILCELMAKTDAPLGVLVDQLEDSFGKTSYGRRDLRLEAEDAETLRTLLPGVNPKSICGKVPQNVSHMDGLRLAFEDDTWLLVRPSGTEPVVRVYAEGFSVEERDELLDAGCALARGTYPL